MTDVAYTCTRCGNTLTRYAWGMEDAIYTVEGTDEVLCEATRQGPRGHTPVASCVDERHAWLAGMCYVHEEDVDLVAATRRIECENCDAVRGAGVR